MITGENSIDRINEKIKNGKANVLTDFEFSEKIQNNRDLKWSDVDVVTASLESTISGTAAMLIVPIAGRGEFKKAKKVWLNDILCFPGPAPNERLGLADTLIFSDQKIENSRGSYSGAELIADLIKKEMIHVKCLSVEGRIYEGSFTIDDVDFARMYIYNLFFNKLCSERGTLKSSSHLLTIRVGSKIILNGVDGLVIGCGTRSNPGNRSLSLAADMFEMELPRIRLSETNGKKQMFNSIGFAIPIMREEIFIDLKACLQKKSIEELKSDAQTGNEMASYLKKRIMLGKFLLASSDIGLDNWF